MENRSVQLKPMMANGLKNHQPSQFPFLTTGNLNEVDKTMVRNFVYSLDLGGHHDHCGVTPNTIVRCCVH